MAVILIKLENIKNKLIWRSFMIYISVVFIDFDLFLIILIVRELGGSFYPRQVPVSLTIKLRSFY